jgi:hypothetical protein
LLTARSSKDFWAFSPMGRVLTSVHREVIVVLCIVNHAIFCGGTPVPVAMRVLLGCWLPLLTLNDVGFGRPVVSLPQ